MKERSGMAYDVVAFSLDETAQLWTPEEEGIFHRLLRHAWVHGSIPDHLPSLAHFCRVTEEVFARVWPTLEGSWPLNLKTHRRTNPKQERERRFREKKKLQSKDAIEKRWAAERRKGKTKVHTSVLRSNAIRNTSQPIPPLPFPTPSILKEGSSSETENSERAVPEFVHLGAHQMIVMTVEEEAAVRHQLGNQFDGLVLELDDYSQSRPDKFRQYKNHAAVLRQWSRRRANEGVRYGHHESKTEARERRNAETARVVVGEFLDRLGGDLQPRVEQESVGDLPRGAPPGSIGSA